MKIAVCLKCIPDPNTVEVDPVTGEMDRSRLLYTLNPADEAALELAMQLRGTTGELIALSVGASEAIASLKLALAVGVDQAIRLWNDNWIDTHPIRTAKVLSAYLSHAFEPDLILCGNKSSDRASGAVPALLAEILGYSCAVSVIDLTLSGQNLHLIRHVGKGVQEEVAIALPAVISVEPGTIRLRNADLPSWIDAHERNIPLLQPLQIRDIEIARKYDLLIPIGIFPRRVRPRPIFKPDSALTPNQRIDQILNAGRKRKSGRRIIGTPKEAAAVISDFLKERGFLNG
jgi:electron transfer flavoprotein beta subunit